MQKYDSWLIALISLVFAGVPALLMLLFFMDTLDFKYLALIGTGLLLWSCLVAFICFFLKVTSVKIFNFLVPLGLVSFSLFLTVNLDWWVMLIVVLVSVLCALPVNMATMRYIEYKRSQILMSRRKGK